MQLQLDKMFGLYSTKQYLKKRSITLLYNKQIHIWVA